MKRFLLSIYLLLATLNISAQYGINTPWTWMKGSNQIANPGSYGVQGLEAVTNVPFSRSGSASFKDASGNLWLFGGMSYQPAPFWWYFDDMWKYNPSTNNWTWMKGSNDVNQGAIYGTMGQSSATNSPGGRVVAASWTDNLGRFWIFGGDAYLPSGWTYDLNDLWMFDPATLQWTWMKGDNTGVAPGYTGTQGVPAPTNLPCGRYGSVSWTDSNGNLWLFGGYTYDTGIPLTDLWKYEPETNNWTWINGPISGAAVYGTQGVPAALNNPGPRVGAVGWRSQDNNLYLFGGLYYSSIYEPLNDLWKYDPQLNQWVWLKGSQFPGQAGFYGTQGVASPTNTPGARVSASGFTDASGDLWLFGGSLIIQYVSNFHNDLWKYNRSLNQWTWMKGDVTFDQPGIYGIQGVPSTSNKPGARAGHSTWTDNLGHFWIFGGVGTDAGGLESELNDLWKINGLNLIPTTLTSFTGRKIYDVTQLNWEMQNTTDLQKFYIERSFDLTNFSTLDSADYYSSQSNYQYVDPLTEVNAKDIYYRLKLSGRNGQSSYSNILHFKSSINIRSLYPNPAKDFINIELNQPASESFRYQVIDVLGKIVVQGKVKNIAGNKILIDVSNLISGSYQLKIISDGSSIVKRFVKQ